MSILSTILYILKKKVKKTVLNRVEFKTIFYYIYPRSSRKESFNKLIALDLLML